MVYDFEMALYGMICIPNIVTINIGVQAILRFGLINLRRCKVGITDGRDL
jgi:hypothetical protein